MSDEHTIIKKIDDMMKTVTKIERGVYGDEDNEVPGLIQTQKIQLERIVKVEGRATTLEDVNKKAIWFGSGAILVVTALWHWLAEWVKKL